MPIDYRYGYGYVKYRRTIKEYIQTIIAYIKKDLYGGCLADYMSPDLEELYCGFIPGRHTILRNENKKHKISKN